MAKQPELSKAISFSTSVTGSRNAAQAEPAPLPPAPDLAEDGPGLTLYTKRHTYEALKRLALAKRTTVHALLIEGVRLLFEHHGLPDAAHAGARPGSKKRVIKAP